MKHHETLGSESVAEQVLSAFYKDIQDWLNEGCLDHTIFNPARETFYFNEARLNWIYDHAKV